MTTAINVPITTSYNGKGIKAASKDIGTLEGLANKLTKAFGGYLAFSQIASFTKTSVKAFTEANQAFTVLSNNLANQGFQISVQKLGDLFDNLEQKFGKDKSVLIPAFQTLVNSTGDLTKSQELLNLALDVAAGTGRDLSAVSLALGKAYAGQTTALSRLGVGLTNANLKGKTFSQIQDTLSQKFSGSAAAAVDTYAGRIQKLQVAFGNAQEAIGKGIIDATTTAFAGSNLSSLENIMKNTADYTANVIRGIGVLGKQINDVINSVPPWLRTAVSSISKFGVLGQLNQLGAKNAKQQADMLASLDDQVATQLANYNAGKKVAETAAKELTAQKAITAQKKDQLALQKAKAILDTAGKVLDVQQAEIVAAMTNASLSENEILRLKLKQALLDDNAKAAGQYAQQLIAAQTASLQLAMLNPFGRMNTDILLATDSLKALAAALAALQVPAINVGQAISTAAGTYYKSSTGLESTNPNAGTFSQYYNGLSGGLYGSIPALPSVNNASTNVTVNVQGSVTTQQDLVAAITQGLYNNQASGIPVNYSTAY